MILVMEGLTSKQIARRLDISPRTVDQHIAAALETLEVPNRMAAVARLYELQQDRGAQTTELSVIEESSGRLEMHILPNRFPRSSPGILPPLGGTQNIASRKQRIDWMVRIAMLCLMLSFACLLTILGISEMVGAWNQ